MTNPQQQWIIATIPVGFQHHCPDDMDEYYYLWNVVFLINTAPNQTQVCTYAETCQQQVLGYYGEDEDDNPNTSVTNDERAWAITEQIIADATELYPFIKPLIGPLTQKYPEGFDLYVSDMQPQFSTAYLHVEEI